MRFTKLFSPVCVSASTVCLAAAMSASGLLAQDEPVQVRVRAIQKDGKVEVVEERVVGEAVPATKKKEEAAETKPADPKVAEDDVGIRARVIRRLQAAAEKAGKTGVVVEEAEAELPSSDYWIGVQLSPVPPEVQKHLPVKHGVLILSVYHDSPAEKAGLKADDILLQAGDAKIETPIDLINAVDAAKTSELKFKVLREGKEQAIAVIPVKRADLELAVTRPPETNARLERLQAAQKQFEKALEALRAETTEEGTVDFMLVRPGAFLARTAGAKMPDDLTIQITKEGNKPAKINVKKGEKSWDVTADKLDDLPKEIRPFVEQMTSGATATLAMKSPHGRFSMNTGVPPQVVVPYPPLVAPVPPLPAIPGTPAVAPRVAWSAAIPAAASDAKLDQILKKLDSLANPDLDEMRKELRSLRKEVEELRSKSK